MKSMSIWTHIYYRSTYIYAKKIFLPLYASPISVGWTNDEIRFLWYYFPLDKNMCLVGFIVLSSAAVV